MTVVVKKRQMLQTAALTVAGSDSCGGAGIQADLRTFAAFGVHGATAVTAVTAQNTEAVSDVRILDATFVEAQMRACLDDLPIGAIKTGMLADAGIVSTVAGRLRAARRESRAVPLVVDPVMIATSGARLLDENAVGALLDDLLPLADLVTPNLPEAAALTGSGSKDPESLAAALLDGGAGAVLVKGGHATGQTVHDVLVTREGATAFEWARAQGAYHGTGCAFAAAVAALLAKGEHLEPAVRRAGGWLQDQIRGAASPRRGELGLLPFGPP